VPCTLSPRRAAERFSRWIARSAGEFVITATSTAAALTGGWPTDAPFAPGSLTVRNTGYGIIFQQLQTYGASATLWVRSTVSASGDQASYPFGSWKDLSAVGIGGGGSASNNPNWAGANTLLQEDFTRRRGGPKILGIGKPAVALRFDHGLKSFDSTIRPLLEARGLPYALAINADMWSHATNAPTTAEMVNTWVGTGQKLCEVWNHGKTHSDASNYADLVTTIVDGLSMLRAQIPAATIDGFMVPGVGGTSYNGFHQGNSAEAFWNTDAGRLILENHAVCSGYIPNSHYRVLDGRIRQGLGHFTIDASTVAEVQTVIGNTKTQKRGLQIMMHPEYINTAGYMSTADSTVVLDYIVAEQTAGRITVVRPYELVYADNTRNAA
jgi:hypothetical protein